MSDVPAFEPAGDLPPGIHPATVASVLARFGLGAASRRRIPHRLSPVHALAKETRNVARFSCLWMTDSTRAC